MQRRKAENKNDEVEEESDKSNKSKRTCENYGRKLLSLIFEYIFTPPPYPEPGMDFAEHRNCCASAVFGNAAAEASRNFSRHVPHRSTAPLSRAFVLHTVRLRHSTNCIVFSGGPRLLHMHAWAATRRIFSKVGTRMSQQLRCVPVSFCCMQKLCLWPFCSCCPLPFMVNDIHPALGNYSFPTTE